MVAAFKAQKAEAFGAMIYWIRAIHPISFGLLKLRMNLGLTAGVQRYANHMTTWSSTSEMTAGLEMAETFQFNESWA